MNGLASVFMPRNLSYVSGLYQNARLADDFGAPVAATGAATTGSATEQDSGRGAWRGPGAEHFPGMPRGRRQLRSEDLLSPSALVSHGGSAPGAAPAPFALTPIVRRRAKSLPSVPGRTSSPEQPCRRRKSVRFADSLGLELTVVRLFNSSEEPSVPTHVLDALHRGALSRFERLDAWDGAGRCHGRCCGGPGDGPGGGEAPSAGPLLRASLVATFPRPPTAPDLASGADGGRLVRLEEATPGELCVAGRVRVLNVAFEKEVTVHFSYDGWGSHAEVRARYVPPRAAVGPCELPGPAGTDVFAFALPTPPFLHPGGALEFAICYRVAGREHWDNNGGVNYRMEVRGCERPLPVPREQDRSWIHFV